MREVRIGEVLHPVRTPITIHSDQEYTSIGIRSFGKGVFHYEKRPGDQLSKLKHFTYPANALALSNIKAWEGAISVTSEAECKTVASSRFLFYAPRNGEADVRYLRHYFLSQRGLAQIGQASPGSADRNRTLSIGSFEKLTVPLPDLSEQRRIADKLDMATSALTEITERRVYMASLQHQLRESMLHSALSGKTTTVRMGDVLSLTREEVDILPNELYQVIGMRSFGKGIIHYPQAPGEELSKLRYFSFPINALALSNIKAWEGAIGVTSKSEDGYIASNRFLFYLPVDNRVNVSYLRHYLLGRTGLAQVSACSPGAADRNRTLGVKRFENIKFELPPRKTQDHIAATLDALHSRMAPAHAEPTLASVRPALLTAAFTGKL